MIYYVPLESYIQRYTAQWSAPETGWLERNWIKHAVPYKRIEPPKIPNEEPRVIKTGSVVDGVGRSIFCFDQIKILLHLAESGQLKSSDVIYFDDFWTPGMEALRYAFDLMKIKPKMYAFLHAQSVDEFDFTYPMRDWIRSVEYAYARMLDGIFVCCPTLAGLVSQFRGIAPAAKVHVTGHPISSEEIMSRMPRWYQDFINGVDPKQGTCYVPNDLRMPDVRHNKVVWSSRWDLEKNPVFFLDVCRQVIKSVPSAQFVICTSAPVLKSNSQWCIDRLRDALRDMPRNLFLKEGLTKEEYYKELTEARVQFNCANQDFVAITLLEASVAGCYPVYPRFRSFPETFRHRDAFMYEHLNLGSASERIVTLLQQSNHLWSRTAIKQRAWIHERFDTSWVRMLEEMDADSYDRLPDELKREADRELFSPVS